MNLKRRSAWCAVMVFCVGAAKADMAFTTVNNGDFGTINLNTGVFSLLGNGGVAPLAGLGVYNGNVYAVDGPFQVGSNLYQVNPADGSLTTIGASGVPYLSFGSTLNALFAVGSDMNLYSINAGTGAAVLVGATGLSSDISQLSVNSSTLYFSNSVNLYTLNTSTGLASLVGSIGANQGALLLENGTLWGAHSAGGGPIYTIDTGTGAGTAGFAITGTGGVAHGFVPDPLPAPEPGSVIFGVAGIAALLALRWRRRAS